MGNKILIIQEVTAENCVEKLDPSDWSILVEFDEELHRKGNFRLVFPRKNNVIKYSKFFIYERFNNLLL
jgi:hypothetical protein